MVSNGSNCSSHYKEGSRKGLASHGSPNNFPYGPSYLHPNLNHQPLPSLSHLPPTHYINPTPNYNYSIPPPFYPDRPRPRAAYPNYYYPPNSHYPSSIPPYTPYHHYLPTPRYIHNYTPYHSVPPSYHHQRYVFIFLFYFILSLEELHHISQWKWIIWMGRMIIT
jgi:hypothetical protein